MKQFGITILIALHFCSTYAQLTYNELTVQYNSAWTCNNLQMIPVIFKNPKLAPEAGAQTMSFSEALKKHKIKLKEIQSENGADINWLQISNQSKQPVLIESGELLGGGKQDRMVADTKILAAGQSDFLHVYCIEKRRWSDKPQDFAHRGTASNNLRKTMDTKNRQHEVWKEIDRQYQVQKKSSETYSYLNLMSEPPGADTICERYFRLKFDSSSSQFAGFIFVTGNNILGCELYASASLARLSFDRLVNNYYRSAMANGSEPKIPTLKIKEFADKFLPDNNLQKTYVEAHGKLFTTNNKTFHLVAYSD